MLQIISLSNAFLWKAHWTKCFISSSLTISKKKKKTEFWRSKTEDGKLHTPHRPNPAKSISWNSVCGCLSTKTTDLCSCYRNFMAKSFIIWSFTGKVCQHWSKYLIRQILFSKQCFIIWEFHSFKLTKVYKNNSKKNNIYVTALGKQRTFWGEESILKLVSGGDFTTTYINRTH